MRVLAIGPKKGAKRQHLAFEIGTEPLYWDGHIPKEKRMVCVGRKGMLFGGKGIETSEEKAKTKGTRKGGKSTTKSPETSVEDIERTFTGERTR